VTVREAAAYFVVSPERIRQWGKAGILTLTKIDGRWMTTIDECERLMSSSIRRRVWANTRRTD
jgi:hypothetical protein